jgi:hypothetical protein
MSFFSELQSRRNFDWKCGIEGRSFYSLTYFFEYNIILTVHFERWWCIPKIRIRKLFDLDDSKNDSSLGISPVPLWKLDRFNSILVYRSSKERRWKIWPTFQLWERVLFCPWRTAAVYYVLLPPDAVSPGQDKRRGLLDAAKVRWTLATKASERKV